MSFGYFWKTPETKCNLLNKWENNMQEIDPHIQNLDDNEHVGIHVHGIPTLGVSFIKLYVSYESLLSDLLASRVIETPYALSCPGGSLNSSLLILHISRAGYHTQDATLLL